ncbi:hypothetical protein [Leptospira levettii]|uniref:hypothetical protein n=1 Tax=Leptospira levettii TaxID=2023178 RepID=UPI001083642A|nr:hypothetical protein [Leptospira levettii]TGM23493.1 hypothetical protein EHQ74_18000 [Leptospira levettii]
MNYYILNIIEEMGNKRVNTVDDWMKQSFAPIFFNETTIDEILANEKPNDAFLFCKRSLDPSWLQSKIVSIGKFDIYVYSPCEKVKDYSKEFQKTNTLVKGCKIQILNKIPIKEAPLVLSSIKSNSFLGRGTFKEISGRDKSYNGNIRAIDFLSEKKLKKIRVKRFEEYLYCLSSLEFETLVAKIFEEMGFFVPAYKGGFIKDFDLIIKNNELNPINILKESIESGKTATIQVKLTMNQIDRICDFSVSIDNINNPKHIGCSILESMLVQCKMTNKWLKELLHWVEFNGE